MQKSFKTILFAVITLTLSVAAFADVKVKIRQTMSGQTSENATYIKGKRQRSEQNIGGMSTVSITQCDLKRGIRLNPQAQVYMIDVWENDTTPASTTVSGNVKTEVRKGGVITTTITTKDTGETRKMFGYTARHLIVTMETEASADACTPMKKSKTVTDGWYIDAAFQLDCDYQTSGGYYPQQKAGGCRDRYDVKNIGTAKRGYPVIEKMTMFDENGRESFTMTNEVLELSNTTLDAALFDIPQGWREAKDSASMYSAANYGQSSSMSTSNSQSTSTMPIPAARPQSDNSSNNSTTLEDKKPGTIRIGVADVKTGSIGEGVNATELAGAIRSTLEQYVKGTKIEFVSLEAKLASAIESEAAEKQCDYVLFATVSHKKGGGGLGMFGKIAPVVGSVVPFGARVSTAGQVATNTVYTAANVSSSIKPKDELTLDITLKKGTANAFAKQFKTKAKSAGEDIISPLVEQAATAIVENAK